MSLTLVFENEKVEITLSGKEQFLSLHKSIVIPFENIVSVEVSSDKKPSIWSKMYGTGVGHYRYGYFNENGKRYFIATKGAHDYLKLVLKNHSYDEIMIDVDDLKETLSSVDKFVKRTS